MPASKNQPKGKLHSCLTIDVEDWFHILDSPAVPGIERWPSLESRIQRNLEEMLALLDSFSVKVTFFWLGVACRTAQGFGIYVSRRRS